MDSGTVGECKRLEAIKIKLPDGVSGSVQYRTHIQDIGWESKWAEDGALSGTSGKAKRLEANPNKTVQVKSLISMISTIVYMLRMLDGSDGLRTVNRPEQQDTLTDWKQLGLS